jgi:asparagine synthase (glutamine-hydrolysing)
LRADDPRYDESPSAIRYAQELGIPQRIETLNAKQALELLDEVVSACSEPFADYSIFPTLLITRLARRDMTVMLSGDGGDELFWGYTSRMGNAIRFAPLFRFPFWQRKLRWWLLRREGEWNTRFFSTAGEWYRSRHERNFEGWLKPVFPTLPPWPANYHHYNYDSNNMDQTAQWVRWNEFYGHLSEVLLKVDRASMYNSLEVRVPLLDREVIETSLRIDWRSCLDLNSGEGKLPLRHSLQRHVSHSTPGKSGFSVPMSDWLRGPLRPLFEELLLSRKELLGLELNPAALRNSYERHLSGQLDQGWGLWIFLSLALWESKHYL